MLVHAIYICLAYTSNDMNRHSTWLQKCVFSMHHTDSPRIILKFFYTAYVDKAHYSHIFCVDTMPPLWLCPNNICSVGDFTKYGKAMIWAFADFVYSINPHSI